MCFSKCLISPGEGERRAKIQKRVLTAVQISDDNQHTTEKQHEKHECCVALPQSKSNMYFVVGLPTLATLLSPMSNFSVLSAVGQAFPIMWFPINNVDIQPRLNSGPM